MIKNKPPLLSVCLITYNHAPYITKAIEGVLMQKVNFNWEFIIADDCSNDGTKEIVTEYAHKFPSLIIPILQRKNVGPGINWMQLMNRPRSKYIAYFEGDDYWTDPLKLQKQVDWMETNPDYSICYHRVWEKRGNTLEEEKMNIEFEDKTYELIDLAKGNIMHTPSVLFRNHFKDGVPEWFLGCSIGDYPLHIFNAQYGKIRYLSDLMAVYRIHDKGMFSTLNQNQKFVKIINTLSKILRSLHLPKDVYQILQNRKNNLIHFLLNGLWKEKSLVNFISIWFKYAKQNPDGSLLWLRTRIIGFFRGRKVGG